MKIRDIFIPLAVLIVPTAGGCSQPASGEAAASGGGPQAAETKLAEAESGSNLADTQDVSQPAPEPAPEPAAAARASLYVDGPARTGEALTLNAVNIAYLYHRMSGEPASVVSMVTEPARQRFEDEFALRRFVNENLPAFQAEVDRTVSAQRYVVQVNGRLERYDFDRGGFPINGLYDRTFLSFDSSRSGAEGMDYSLSLGNTDELDFIEVSEADAEALNLGGSRAVDLMVEFVPVQAGWAKPRDDIFRTVDAIATRIEVVAREGGQVIGGREAATPAPDGPLRLYAQNPFAEPDFVNPWSADNAPEAVLDRYSWIVNEHWRMDDMRMESGESFYDALSLRGAAAESCIGDFGYSQCQRLATARSEFIDRCVRDVPQNRSRECYAISDFPYTELEADAR